MKNGVRGTVSGVILVTCVMWWDAEKGIVCLQEGRVFLSKTSCPAVRDSFRPVLLFFPLFSNAQPYLTCLKPPASLLNTWPKLTWSFLPCLVALLFLVPLLESVGSTNQIHCYKQLCSDYHAGGATAIFATLTVFVPFKYAQQYSEGCCLVLPRCYAKIN